MAWVRCCGGASAPVYSKYIYSVPSVMLGAFTYTATNSYSVTNLSDGYHIDSTGNSPSTVTFWNTTDFNTGGNKYLSITYTRSGSGSCYMTYGGKSIALPTGTDTTVKLDVSDLDPSVDYRITIYNNTGNNENSYLTMKELAFVNS